MDFDFKEDPKVVAARIQAARLGCGMCRSPIPIRAASDPFSKGPFIGRFWCMDCWTLYWDEHPEHLADEESRAYVREDAKRIRLRRGSKLVYEEGNDRVFRTAKGTLVFDLRTSRELAPNEFDPARLAVLERALKALQTQEPASAQVG